MRDSKYMIRGWLAAAAIGVTATFTGCQQQTITTYEIPKEDYSVKMPSMPGMTGGGAAQDEARPELKWTVPKGWVDRTGQGQMGIGSFRVEAEEGKYADVRIIPLRAGPEIEQRSVNMWREELGLPELPVDAIHGEEIDVADAHTHLYDLTSQELKFGGKFKARTTGAVIEKAGMLWFVKMVGEESVVASQQQQFREFLKSFKFEAPSAATPSTQTAHAHAPGSAAGADWKTPEGWQKQTPGQMVLAAYKATKNGKTADIQVSSFPGDVGGTFANVNRWRGQVGAAPISEADLAKETKQIELAGGAKATAVDVKGNKRLYGLMVKRGDKTWFYKMVGDSEVIDAEAANLAAFAATAH